MEEEPLLRDSNLPDAHDALQTPPAGHFNPHHSIARACKKLSNTVTIDAPTLFALVASIGNLLQGWDNASIAGAIFYIEEEFRLQSSPMINGLIMAMALIGAGISTLLSGRWADPLGRRIMLLTSSILSLTSELLMIFLSQKIYMIIIVRFISGLSIGLAVTHVPLYISEIAPAETRGKLNTFPQLSGSVGMFISYCMVFWMSLTPKVDWRNMIAVELIPSLVYTILIIFYLPESPRWLVTQGRVDEARIVLQRLQRREDVSGEMASLLEGTYIGHIPIKKEFIIGPTDEIKLFSSGEQVKLYGLKEDLSCIICQSKDENSQSKTNSLMRIGSSFFDPIVILTESVNENEADNICNETQDTNSSNEENQYTELDEENQYTELDKAQVSDEAEDEDNQYVSEGEDGIGQRLYTVGGGWQLTWKLVEEDGLDENTQSGIERVYLHEKCKGTQIDASLSNQFIKVTALVNRSVFPQHNNHNSIEAIGQMFSYLLETGVRKALMVGITIQILQQFAGINGILYYTPVILIQVGVGDVLSSFDLNSSSKSILLSAITTLLMLPCIGTAVWLVDIKGRRHILLSTIPILLISLIILVAANVMDMRTDLHATISALCVIVYQCIFVMGFGPIPNILCAEIFPTRVRAICLVLCSLTFWICDTIVTYIFPILMEKIGLAGVFGIFAIVCALAVLFVYFKVPETKGIPLEVMSECYACTDSTSRPSKDEDEGSKEEK
ncbi:monosaccharide-sensing protein 2-like [Oryza brachyantha]|uniref:monosaccharide-sensing protein 2-like n=1 Tax=Oryza brachyantha TaxID=4533 RepID=UPI0003EA92AC|nr:monosaccharide-sensing protein 2-like [Oryza brachyantha]